MPILLAGSLLTFHFTAFRGFHHEQAIAWAPRSHGKEVASVNKHATLSLLTILKLGLFTYHPFLHFCLRVYQLKLTHAHTHTHVLAKMVSGDNILTLAFRVLQLLFSATVLGLSISLIQGNILGNPPLSLTFSAFVGGVSMVGALSGLAAVWVQMLQGRIGLTIDAAIAAFNIAGGVVSTLDPAY